MHHCSSEAVCSLNAHVWKALSPPGDGFVKCALLAGSVGMRGWPRDRMLEFQPLLLPVSLFYFLGHDSEI